MAILSVYPLALTLSVAIDTLFGPRAFFDELSFGTRQRLFAQLLQDWASSAVWWLPIALLVLLCTTSRWNRGCVYLSLGIGLIILSVTYVTAAIPAFLAATVGFAFIMPALVNLRHI